MIDGQEWKRSQERWNANRKAEEAQKGEGFFKRIFGRGNQSQEKPEARILDIREIPPMPEEKADNPEGKITFLDASPSEELDLAPYKVLEAAPADISEQSTEKPQAPPSLDNVAENFERVKRTLKANPAPLEPSPEPELLLTEDMQASSEEPSNISPTPTFEIPEAPPAPPQEENSEESSSSAAEQETEKIEQSQSKSGSNRVRHTIAKNQGREEGRGQEPDQPEKKGEAEETEREEIPMGSELVPLPRPEMSKTEQLRQQLEQARLAYVQHDYEKTTKMKSLQLVLGKLDSLDEDPELTQYRENYEQAVKAFQSSELDALKKENVSNEELESRVEGLLRFARMDEQLSLRQAYADLRIEKQSILGKVYEGAKSLGRRYNALPKKYKWGIIGATIAGAAVLSAAGAAGAAAGGGLLLARRLVSGAALAVTAEGITDLVGNKREEKRISQSVESDIQSLNSSEAASENFVLDRERLAKLQALLDQNAESVDQRFKEHKKHTYRKWLASGALGALFGGGAYIADFLHDSPEVPVSEGAPETPVPEGDGVVSAVEAAAGPEVSPPVLPETVLQEALTGTVESHATETAVTGTHEALASDSLAKVATEAVVTTEDANKGLWGILENRLPADMPVAEKNRAIMALETIIQKKLETMDAAGWETAGFPSGDINTIHPGDTLHLENLLSGQEVQDVMEGKMAAVSESLSHAAQPAAEHAASAHEAGPLHPHDEVLKKATEVSAKAPLVEPTPSATPIVPAEKLALAENSYSVAESDPKAFLAEYPELKSRLYPAVSGLANEVFLIDEMTDEQFKAFSPLIESHTLDNVSVERVLNHYNHLAENPKYNYSARLNPLDIKQMANVSRLTRYASEKFGAAGAVQPKEGLRHYFERIATLMLRERLKNPSFKLSF
ncbi:MAG: hypothetical protein WDN67_01500 [Candidatus Moraniibacteriota bacterium]